jgi:hypothetical protein
MEQPVFEDPPVIEDLTVVPQWVRFILRDTNLPSLYTASAVEIQLQSGRVLRIPIGDDVQLGWAQGADYAPPASLGEEIPPSPRQPGELDLSYEISQLGTAIFLQIDPDDGDSAVDDQEHLLVNDDSDSEAAHQASTVDVASSASCEFRNISTQEDLTDNSAPTSNSDLLADAPPVLRYGPPEEIDPQSDSEYDASELWELLTSPYHYFSDTEDEEFGPIRHRLWTRPRTPPPAIGSDDDVYPSTSQHFLPPE